MEILKNFLWALTFFAPRAISVLEQIIQSKGGLPTFHLDYRDPLPIYEQLKQECKRLILSGIIAPGDKLPSVRELAGSLSINPNTIQRAYRELEADGYLISVPGKGSFAAEARPLQEQKKQELLKEMKGKKQELFSKIRSLSQQAMALGATREELLAQIPTKEEEA